MKRSILVPIALVALSLHLSAQPPQPSKASTPIKFDALNDYVSKGLPPPADINSPSLDDAAYLMASMIMKGDPNSLPAALTAVQTAGYTVLDDDGNVILKPRGGNGVGVGVYAFEIVGGLKMADRGTYTSLDRITAAITKKVPEISSGELSALILDDLRTDYTSPNPYLRFSARLIVALGNATPYGSNLMTAAAPDVRLSLLQATLLIRRVQAGLFSVQKRTGPSAGWRRTEQYSPSAPAFSLFENVGFRVTRDLPCQLSNNEAIYLDAAAVLMTYGNGKVVEWAGEKTLSAAGQASLSKVSAGLVGANLALGWIKLVASVTTLEGEMSVSEPLPLIRTVNSTPGEKRMLQAKIRSVIGKIQMLNCVRVVLNSVTGLDFNLPTDGPVGNVSVEWHLDDDLTQSVKNVKDAKYGRFVTFKSPEGQDPNPLKQVTNDDGIAKMWLYGAGKIPEVGSRPYVKVQKTAKVLLGVTLKSSKDVTQNAVDMIGTILGTASGGPLGLLAAVPELGYRVPYVIAQAEVPVTDHEPCDGDWYGTINYSVTMNSTINSVPVPPTGGTQDGGHKTDTMSTTLSGTVTVHGANNAGNSSDVSASYDYLTTEVASANGRIACQNKTVPWSGNVFKSNYGSGTADGSAVVSITFDGDSYKVSVRPIAVPIDLQLTSQSSGAGCLGGHYSAFKPSSTSQSTKTVGGSNDPVLGSARLGADTNVLSGADSKSIKAGPLAVVTSISWNLRKCK